MESPASVTIRSLNYRRHIHLKTFAARALFCSLLSLVLAESFLLTSAAQETAPSNPPATPQAQTTQAPPTAQNKDAQDSKKTSDEATSTDRLFFALPNFLTLENAGNVPPLTVGQKFKVVARGTFDYIQIPWYAALAGISQAENSEPGYGQGAEGYGKRFGSAAADGTIENFMTSAILPSLLRQDPRFFQESEGGVWHRTRYAVGRIFITRTDSGHQQFNFSEICGSAAAAAISTYSYHPSADRTLSNTASVWGTQVGYDTITYAVKEFWPDVRRKLSKKKDSPSN
jgi:hypothetical protein